MISLETDNPPSSFEFDVAIAAVGYEPRCRWVVEQTGTRAETQIALSFGFLEQGAFAENLSFFRDRSFDTLQGLSASTVEDICDRVSRSFTGRNIRIFVDISCMSREMIANIALAVRQLAESFDISISVAYAPSHFEGDYPTAPIRRSGPIKPELAGWSAQPEKPLGTIFGMGCERNLALGALQVLEPNTGWTFYPHGVDPRFDAAVEAANPHVREIFNVVRVGYDIREPTVARARFEVLLRSVEQDYRLIVVPFGPKIFSWCALATIIFNDRNDVGVWTFSSREHASLVDRTAEGPIIWHQLQLAGSAAAHG
jgi:hypothetical protein